MFSQTRQVDIGWIASFQLAIGLTLSACSAVVAQTEAASVVVARVIQREVNTAMRVVGTVMPVRRSTIGSAVDGRVVEFLVNQGDAVKKGQPLARLRTETLEIELAASRAELDLYEQELLEKVNGSRPEEIAEAKARMRAAKAIVNNARSRLDRVQTLFESHATSAVELDDARERALAAQQTFLAAEANSKRVELGPRIEQIAQAQSRVALQTQRVRLIEDRINRFTISTPFDGFIAEEHTDVGEWIQQGDPIVQVVALDEVEVQVNVPAEHAVRLQRGRSVRIEFPELPGDIFTGVVDQVVPTGNVTTRTFPVNIRLKNRLQGCRPLLMAGLLARADLPTGPASRLPLVPKDALVLNGPRRSVLIVELIAPSGTRGHVRVVPVRLGVASGELIQVEADIEAGDLVVVLGNERLVDGQEVVVTGMQSPEPSPTP